LTVSYEAAQKRAEPYNQLAGELPEMRKETVSLAIDERLPGLDFDVVHPRGAIHCLIPYFP